MFTSRARNLLGDGLRVMPEEPLRPPQVPAGEVEAPGQLVEEDTEMPLRVVEQPMLLLVVQTLLPVRGRKAMETEEPRGIRLVDPAAVRIAVRDVEHRLLQGVQPWVDAVKAPEVYGTELV